MVRHDPVLPFEKEQEDPPEQQSMDGPGWEIPGNADPYFRKGIDWADWEGRAKPPPAYNPPQLAPGFIPCWLCPRCNWWQQRSPMLESPLVPCGLAPCCYRCCIGNVEYLSFAEPDEWMVKMMSTGTSPKCPKHLLGIWWLQDNIAAHEHLVTFHDANWVSDRLALKVLAHNWTRGPTAFGACLFFFVQSNGNTLRIEISPNGKWISIAGSSGNPTWIYITGEDDHFSLPAGGTLQLDPGELQRVSFKNDADPASGLSYQCRVRRIAHMDDAGRLLKTPAYAELLQCASMPMKYEPCCCGYRWCLSKEQLALGNFPQLPTHTVVKYAPPAPGA